MPQVSGTTLWNLLGWTLLTSGILLALWSLFWDRSRGRLRCPRCWYRVEGVPISLLKFHHRQREAMKCPECGEVITDERMLIRTRRRWRALVPALLLLILTPQAWDQPGRIKDNETWSRAVPTWITACALQWNDTNVRADVKMLLSVRRTRCNALERVWMDWWREKTLRFDAREQLSYRSTVVAGMPFGVSANPESSRSYFQGSPNVPSSSRVFTVPIPISPALESRSFRLLDNKDSENKLDDDFVSMSWPRHASFRVIAPTEPGQHTIWVPMQENYAVDPIQLDAPIVVTVLPDVSDVLTPITDDVFKEQIRKWMRVRILANDHARVWYVGEERKINYALTCEILQDGVVVAHSPTPLLPMYDRSTQITLGPGVLQQLQRFRSKAATPTGWTLRVRGAPEVTHEFTFDSTYWKGEVEIPLDNALE